MIRALVLYNSLFGNTKKIAFNLANGISEGDIKVDCLNINDVNLDDISRYDFVSIGGPTHNIGLSKQMKVFLDRIKNFDLRGIKGFAFDTRYHSRLNKKRWIFLENSAARKIEKKMKKINIKIIKSRESALVEKGREGPLLPGIEEKFKDIGRELGQKINGVEQ